MLSKLSKFFTDNTYSTLETTEIADDRGRNLEKSQIEYKPR